MFIEMTRVWWLKHRPPECLLFSLPLLRILPSVWRNPVVTSSCPQNFTWQRCTDTCHVPAPGEVLVILSLTVLPAQEATWDTVRGKQTAAGRQTWQKTPCQAPTGLWRDQTGLYLEGDICTWMLKTWWDGPDKQEWKRQKKPSKCPECD